MPYSGRARVRRPWARARGLGSRTHIRTTGIISSKVSRDGILQRPKAVGLAEFGDLFRLAQHDASLPTDRPADMAIQLIRTIGQFTRAATCFNMGRFPVP